MGAYIKINGEYQYVPSPWERLQAENDADGRAQWEEYKAEERNNANN